MCVNVKINEDICYITCWRFICEVDTQVLQIFIVLQSFKSESKSWESDQLLPSGQCKQVAGAILTVTHASGDTGDSDQAPVWHQCYSGHSDVTRHWSHARQLLAAAYYTRTH